MPFAALGGILPGHPFDVLYNHGLRHLLGTPTLPRYGWLALAALPPNVQVAHRPPPVGPKEMGRESHTPVLIELGPVPSA